MPRPEADRLRAGRRGPERPPASLSGALATVLSAAALGALVLANAILGQRAGMPPRASAPRPDPEWAARFPLGVDRVTEALGQLPLHLPAPIEDPRGSGRITWVHRHYEITLPVPEDRRQIERLFAPLESAAPGVTVHCSQSENGAQVQIGIDGLLTHSVTVYWLGHRPRVAIVLTDMGSDLRLAREIVGMSIPLTLAVQPLLPFARQVGELATIFSREVLIQLPSLVTPESQPGRGRTQRGANGERDSTLLAAATAALPQARGATASGGALAAAGEAVLRATCEQLKARELFLVDPSTGGNGPACRIAREVGLPCASGDVSLDGAGQETGLALEFESMITLVRTRGDIIATTPATPATLDALRAALPRLTNAGVEVVPVSSVLADRSFTRR